MLGDHSSLFSPDAICWLNRQGKAGLDQAETADTDIKSITMLHLATLERSLENSSEKPNTYFLRWNKNAQNYFTGLKLRKGQTLIFS